MRQTMHDLTGFKRDCLYAICTLGKPHGLAVKNFMEVHMDYPEVRHGRLYPNLDDLVDMGLIDKGKKDRRTNEYRVTDRGLREVRARKDVVDVAVAFMERRGADFEGAAGDITDLPSASDGGVEGVDVPSRTDAGR